VKFWILRITFESMATGGLERSTLAIRPPSRLSRWGASSGRAVAVHREYRSRSSIPFVRSTSPNWSDGVIRPTSYDTPYQYEETVQ